LLQSLKPDIVNHLGHITDSCRRSAHFIRAANHYFTGLPVHVSVE
jgi:hypothetical protein